MKIKHLLIIFVFIVNTGSSFGYENELVGKTVGLSKVDISIDTTYKELEKCDIPYETVMIFAEESGVKPYLDKYLIDILDLDIMSWTCANNPFYIWKERRFKNNEKQKYIDIIPEENLMQFYSIVRKYYYDNK